MQDLGYSAQQCQLLLARMSKSSGFVDQVRQLIVARPGYFRDRATEKHALIIQLPGATCSACFLKFAAPDHLPIYIDRTIR